MYVLGGFVCSSESILEISRELTVLLPEGLENVAWLTQTER